MIEITGDLWNVDVDVILVTTNGIVKSDGSAVMGAGIAKQAKDRYPGLEFILGGMITKFGNVPCPLYFDILTEKFIGSFPTKHHWKDDSDLRLIEKSAKFIVYIFNEHPDMSVAMPRPGCGLGNLDWDTQVKPLLESILTEDRYVVVDNGKK